MKRGKSYIAREDRTCRLCSQVLEISEHAWLDCDAAGELQQLNCNWVTRADGDVVESTKRLVALSLSAAGRPGSAARF